VHAQQLHPAETNVTLSVHVMDGSNRRSNIRPYASEKSTMTLAKVGAQTSHLSNKWLKITQGGIGQLHFSTGMRRFNIASGSETTMSSGPFLFLRRLVVS